MQEKFASLQVCRELLDMSSDVEALPELFIIIIIYFIFQTKT
jgi:hypothetical protein